MGNAQRRLQQRKKALNRISELITQSERVVVIHYSCESFYGPSDGTSPRITSIAVRNLATGQTVSFSIHQMAEREGVPYGDIEQEYDRLEKAMLDDFYGYVHGHQGYIWLHWNMRDINYGFAAIAHRCKVLGGAPIDIHESDLRDLARLIPEIYSAEYIEHPRLEKLVDKNQITKLDFLGGASEANAFTEKEYVKLHRSTLRKVDILANIVELVDKGDLKTNSTWKDIYGHYPAAIGEFLKEHWIFSLVGFVGTIWGLLSWLF